jgi:hypothetical protein
MTRQGHEEGCGATCDGPHDDVMCWTHGMLEICPPCSCWELLNAKVAKLQAYIKKLEAKERS